MSHQLTISTELDNRTFVPGEQIRGQVEWEGGDPAKRMDGEVRLFFYTSGKGTRDVKVVDKRHVPGTGAYGKSVFEFTIPENSPPSFSGKILSVIWAIEFQIGKRGDSARYEITVSPTGEEIRLYKYDDGNLPESSDFKTGKSRWKKQKG